MGRFRQKQGRAVWTSLTPTRTLKTIRRDRISYCSVWKRYLDHDAGKGTTSNHNIPEDAEKNRRDATQVPRKQCWGHGDSGLVGLDYQGYTCRRE